MPHPSARLSTRRRVALTALLALVVLGVAPAANATPRTTPRQPAQPTSFKIYVGVVHLKGATVADPLSDASIKSEFANLSSFLSRETGLAITASVVDIHRLEVPSTCDWSRLSEVDAIVQQSFGDALRFADDTKLVVYHDGPCSGGNGGGVAGLGGIDLVAHSGVLAHEFGHTLGRGHAGVYNCQAVAGAAGGPWDDDSKVCRATEYGDMWDFVGQNYPTYVTPLSRYMFGWLSPSQYQVVDSTYSGMIGLVPFSGTATGKQVILVTDPAGGADIVVEQRPAGPEGFSGYPAGVYVTRAAGHTSTLVTPADQGTTTLATPLALGQTYRSAGGAVRVTVEQVSSTGAQVRVERANQAFVGVDWPNSLLGAWVSTLRESCWGPGGRAGGCPGAVWRSGAG